MDKTAYLNLTYNSPSEDFDLCTGLNPDGTPNILFTLQSVRELLSFNLSQLDKLLENKDHIKNIYCIGFGEIEIETDTEESCNKMLAEKLLYRQGDIDSDDLSQIEEIQSSSDEETHNKRLDKVKNMVNSDDTKLILNENLGSDSDFESETDDIIYDEKSTHDILKKYSSLVASDKEDEETSESDCNMD